jgi:hypothetical protein
MVARPVLLSICETHAAEHVLLAAGDAHAGHDHGHHHDGDDGSRHAHGPHGLQHQGAGVAFAPVVPHVALTLLHLPRMGLPPPDEHDVPVRSPTSPFRPPIA